MNERILVPINIGRESFFYALNLKRNQMDCIRYLCIIPNFSPMQLSYFKSLTLFSSALLAFIVMAFSNNSAPESTTLLEAIKMNKVDSELSSNGSYNGYTVNIQLTNNSNKTLNIRIPAGTKYHPEDEGEQTLIQMEDQFIALKPHGNYKGQIAAFCTEANDRCPTENTGMKMTLNKDPKFDKLFAFVRDKKVNKTTYQDAVWAISDNHSVANIEANDASSVALRKYVAEITGQKNTWYTTPQQVTIDEAGNFRRESVTIQGTLVFDCSKGDKIYQDIHKENGDVYMSSDQSFTSPVAHMNMDFKLRVKGWEKGNYYIYLHDGSNQLARFDFTI